MKWYEFLGWAVALFVAALLLLALIEIVAAGFRRARRKRAAGISPWVWDFITRSSPDSIERLIRKERELKQSLERGKENKEEPDA